MSKLKTIVLIQVVIILILLGAVVTKEKMVSAMTEYTMDTTIHLNK